MTGRALILAAAIPLAGCGGEDGGAEPEPGARLFESAGCAGCHTLRAAGADGKLGPDLDQIRPDAARIAAQVRRGGSGMPAFADRLSATEIETIARYVANAAGGSRDP
jgi:mono/diheme cytochrome c family protein